MDDATRAAVEGCEAAGSALARAAEDYDLAAGLALSATAAGLIFGSDADCDLFRRASDRLADAMKAAGVARFHRAGMLYEARVEWRVDTFELRDGVARSPWPPEAPDWRPDALIPEDWRA